MGSSSTKKAKNQENRLPREDAISLLPILN